MRNVTHTLLGVSTILLAVVLAGCGGGTKFGISVSLTTSPSPTIDEGQVVTITAAVVNDQANKGVTWTLSGHGSLSNASATQVTYVAPAIITTPIKATVTATSVSDTSATASISVQVNPPPSITTTSLPSGTAGTCYGQTSTSSGITCNGEALSESGGTAPYTWGVTSGQLPPGLSLNPGSGLVSGIPTTPGTYNPTISLSDAAGFSTSAKVSITIANPPALTITTSTLPNAALNVKYDFALSATGGVAPYNWAAPASSSLPAGLKLSPAGVISGVPVAPTGTFSFTVQVTDSEGPSPVTVNQKLSLIVNTNPFSITTTALPSGTENIGYSTTLQTIGGTGGVTWSVSSGALPGWVSPAPTNGVISGTPNVATTTSFTMEATDSAGDIALQALSITISSTTQDALLNGQYAFSLAGYDGGLVGSFTADGKGGIIAGTEDLEDAAKGLHAADVGIVAATNSYTIGADGRGILTYTDNAGNIFTFDLALTAVSSPSGASSGGAMIETDTTTGANFTGSFALQNSSAFSSTALTGGYAFGFSGWDKNAHPDVVVGSASISSGSVSSGLLDENDAGSLSSAVAFGGTLSINGTNGRGTITSSTSSAPQASFVFYVISPTEWFAIAYNTSTNVVRTGLVEQQSGGPYSIPSINGTMVLQSQSSTSTLAPEAEVGLLTSAGTGSASTSLDVDQAGSVSSQSDTYTLAFTSSTNGRFTGTPATSGGFVGYMIAPNQAFIAGTGTEPSFGTFEPQPTATFSAASLNGSFFLESLPLVSPLPSGQTPTYSSGFLSFDAISNLSGTIDSSHAGTATTTELTDTYSVATNGRVSISPGGAIMYIVSSSKIIIMSTGLAGSTNPLIEIAQR